jgi:hypothetical protein
MEAYKWEADTQIEIGHERPAKRYLVRGMGGLCVMILKLKNGNLLAIARGGDASVGERGMLEGLLSPDGGVSWTRPFTVAASGPDNRNHSAIELSDGTILVGYAEADNYLNGRPNKEKAAEKGSALRTVCSRDGGHTWSQPRPVAEPGPPVRAPYGKMVELPDSTILMPVYHSDDPENSSWIYRSRNGGETWVDITRIAEGFNETALMHLPSGKLIAMMRVDHRSRPASETKYQDSDTGAWVGGRSVWQSDSLDGGYTWNEPKQVTGAEEHPADLLLLQSGKILLTYGHRMVPHGVRGMISYDEGETWDTEHEITLAADSADNGCGYPSSVQLDDGTICTAFCVKHSLAYERLGPHGALLRYREEDILPGTVMK